MKVSEYNKYFLRLGSQGPLPQGFVGAHVTHVLLILITSIGWQFVQVNVHHKALCSTQLLWHGWAFNTKTLLHFSDVVDCGETHTTWFCFILIMSIRGHSLFKPLVVWHIQIRPCRLDSSIRLSPVVKTTQRHMSSKSTQWFTCLLITRNSQFAKVTFLVVNQTLL